MRVAWFGPNPDDDAGVPYVATQLLHQLGNLGLQIDCFLTCSTEELPPSLLDQPNLTFVCRPARWAWDRWYSRKPLAAFVTGQSMRAAAQLGLGRELGCRHAKRPYDVLYQFSQIEAVAARRLRARPRFVLHPEVHAAGELRWHRQEEHLTRRCEPRVRRVAVRGLLWSRSQAQSHDVRLADAVIAPSSRFATDLVADYGVAPDRMRVVPNPVDLERYKPASREGDPKRVTLLFVGRISVRKGVETIIALSHRLADLADRVRLVVVGSHTLWSDYRPLLSSLNTAVASFQGAATPSEMADIYRGADLLVQPSHYEPFGLTVAEGLASGLPAVVTDAVGAADDISPECCRVVPDGDVDALEREIRSFARLFVQGDGARVRELARREAVRRFAPPVVARQVADVLGGADIDPTGAPA